MPAAITLDAAYDILFDEMPDWQTGISHASWIDRWQSATGCSRRTAYRMQGFALEIDAALFALFVEEHPNLPHGEAMIRAYNDHWGIPCEWEKLRGKTNAEGKRIPGLVAA